jgi:hypothetical protein
MTIKNLNILVMTLSVGLFFSCRSHKMKKKAIDLPAVTQEVKTEIKDTLQNYTDSVKFEKVTFNMPQVDFDKLKIKSKISIKSSKIDQNIPVTIHVKKDSIIWISVALGLEAARATIDKDSIALLDRLNRNYYQLSFKELSEKLQFDVSYAMIQSLLIGNLPIGVDSSDQFVLAQDFNKIVQQRSFLNILNLFEPSKNQLIKINAEDTRNNSKMTIFYDAFITENNFIVPTLINLKVTNSANQEALINFEHNKFDFLDRNIRFPFNIPKGYKKAELPNF